MSSIGVQQSGVRVVLPLNDDDRRELLTLANSVTAEALRTGERKLPVLDQLPPRLRENGASFVTLRRGTQLLGTFGALEPTRALGLDVAEHALAAAFDDPRLPVIDLEDWQSMSVEIAIIGPLVPTQAATFDELRRMLRPDRDGLVVRYHDRQVTFLPGVWQTVRDVDDFLALLWRKAGLSPGAWSPDIHTATYRTETVSDGPPG
jgi:AmmeMemoRadiSam system protein A